MSSLVEFIAKLATDPAALESFKADPEAYMRSEGLSAAEQNALRSGDAGTIREEICYDLSEGVRIQTTAGERELVLLIRDLPGGSKDSS